MEGVFLEPLKKKDKLPLSDPLLLTSNHISDSCQGASVYRAKGHTVASAVWVTAEPRFPPQQREGALRVPAGSPE